MLRGFIKFHCSECGEIFKAPDIEWQATPLSVPQKCPKCGSMHTRPLKGLLSIIFTFQYRRLWKEMDGKK